MIEILMVDDHTIFRTGIRRLLTDENDMRIVAEAGNGHEAIEHLRRRAFDLVLLDVNMGGRSGLDTMHRIREEWPRLPVIMLSMYPEEQYAPMAFALGANGYLSKDRDAEQLVATIRGTTGGGCYLPPGMQRSVMRQGGGAPLHQRLTEREWEILRLIIQGVSLTEIGVRLSLSVKTISTYRTRLLAKLNLASNAELVRYCLEQGISD